MASAIIKHFYPFLSINGCRAANLSCINTCWIKCEECNPVWYQKSKLISWQRFTRGHLILSQRNMINFLPNIHSCGNQWRLIWCWLWFTLMKKQNKKTPLNWEKMGQIKRMKPDVNKCYNLNSPWMDRRYNHPHRGVWLVVRIILFIFANCVNSRFYERWNRKLDRITPI